jgi:hypothetical protein
VAKPKPQKLAASSKSPLSVAFGHLAGGWRRYITYVDYAARQGDEAMARYRDCYQTLMRKSKDCWPEQICDLAIAAVCKAVWNTNAAESSVISSIAHPQLLAKTIQFAQKEDNYSDRELYFRLMGSLPDKKGTSINIFQQAIGAPPPMPELGQTAAPLRSFDDEVVEMSRDLEVPDAPFMVKNVPPDNHQ